jgi:hypothetical protein
MDGTYVGCKKIRTGRKNVNLFLDILRHMLTALLTFEKIIS